METYLNDVTSWFEEQGRKVLIAVGHGIRTDPLILNVVYPILKMVLFVDTTGILSPLQLDAMFEFHECYRILVMHNLLAENAPMHTGLPICKIFSLLYSLQVLRTVTPTAIVSE